MIMGMAWKRLCVAAAVSATVLGCLYRRDEPPIVLDQGDVTGVVVGVPPGQVGSRALSAARVRVRGGAVLRSSAADGRFVLRNLPAGQHVVEIIWDPDRNGVADLGKVLAVPIRVRAGKRASVDLGTVELLRPGTVTGSVGPSAQGPFEDVVVNLFQRNPVSGAFEVVGTHTFAQNDGTFRVEGVGEGSWQAQAARAGAASPRLEFAITPDGTVSLDPLLLDPGAVNGTLSGSLVTPEAPTGTSATGVITQPLIPAPITIRLTRVPDGLSRQESCPGNLCPDGQAVEQFNIPNVPPGVYNVEVDLPPPADNSTATPDAYQDFSFAFVVVANEVSDLGALIVSRLPGDTGCIDVDGDGLCFAGNQHCVQACTSAGRDLDAPCDEDGRRYDCDDDLDGQADAEEVALCRCGVTGPLPNGPSCEGDPLRADRDLDGICDLFDRFPTCAANQEPCTPPADGGVMDASIPDGAMPDAALPDAGIPDAATPDAAIGPFGTTNQAVVTGGTAPITDGGLYNSDPTDSALLPLPGGGWLTLVTAAEGVTFPGSACPAVPTPLVTGSTTAALVRLGTHGRCLWRAVLQLTNSSSFGGPPPFMSVAGGNGRVYVAVAGQAQSELVVDGVAAPMSQGVMLLAMDDPPTPASVIRRALTPGGAVGNGGATPVSLRWDPAGFLGVLIQTELGAVAPLGLGLPPQSGMPALVVIRFSEDLATAVEGAAAAPQDSPMGFGTLQAGSLVFGAYAQAPWLLHSKQLDAGPGNFGAGGLVVTLPDPPGGTGPVTPVAASLPWQFTTTNFADPPVPTVTPAAGGWWRVAFRAVPGTLLLDGFSLNTVTPNDDVAMRMQPASQSQAGAWAVLFSDEPAPTTSRGDGTYIPPPRVAHTATGGTVLVRNTHGRGTLVRRLTVTGAAAVLDELARPTAGADPHVQWVRLDASGAVVQAGAVLPQGAGSSAQVVDVTEESDGALVLSLRMGGTALATQVDCSGNPLPAGQETLMGATNTLVLWRVPPGAAVPCAMVPITGVANDPPADPSSTGLPPVSGADVGGTVDVTLEPGADQDCFALQDFGAVRVELMPDNAAGCTSDLVLESYAANGQFSTLINRQDLLPPACEVVHVDDNNGTPVVCVRGHAYHPAPTRTLRLSRPTVPANDTCAMVPGPVITMGVGNPTARIQGATWGATEDTGFGNTICGDAPGLDIFFPLNITQAGGIKFTDLYTDQGSAMSNGTFWMGSTACPYQPTACVTAQPSSYLPTSAGAHTLAFSTNVEDSPGYLDAQVTFVPNATNDSCITAMDLGTVGPGAQTLDVQGHTVGATPGVVPASVTCTNLDPGAPDVAYRFRVAAPGEMVAYNTDALIMDGCSGTAPYTCGGFGSYAQLTSTLNTYTLAVGGGSFNAGIYAVPHDFSVPLEFVPGATNTFCSGPTPLALALGAAPVLLEDTTALATFAPNITTCTSATRGGYFRFNPQSDGVVHLRMAPSSGIGNLDMSYGLDGNCPFRAEVCTAGGVGFGQDQYVAVTAGASLSVGLYSSSVGGYQVEADLVTAPGNTCNTALTANYGGTTLTLNATTATATGVVDTNNSACIVDNRNPDVFARLTLASASELAFTVVGQDPPPPNLMLYVLGTTCATQPGTCNALLPNVPVTRRLGAGAAWLAFKGASAFDRGPFQLRVDPHYPNGTFTAAQCSGATTDLLAGRPSGVLSGQFLAGMATDNHSPAAAGCTAVGNGVDQVVQAMIPAGRTLSLQSFVDASGAESGALWVAQGCGATFSTCVAATDAAASNAPEMLQITNSTASAQPYYIVMEGLGGATSYRLAWQLEP